MRLKNIPQSKDAIEKSALCISDPVSYKGHWSKSFFQDKPLFIEIGTGKGQFIMSQSLLNPNIGYLGIEYYSSVIYRALQKLEADPRDNLKLIRFDANNVLEIFAPREVDHLFLNFSDPWPKDRHAKRRLTSPGFLDKYDIILSEEAIIEFKTDNRQLFDYSVQTITEHPAFELSSLTYDLYSDEKMLSGNIPTEYEERFTSEGKPICKLIAVHTGS
ncbi:MAG: tRNA (guanosine(46)-N7)-methyltransferase TrmB [Lachnospiraceae bacterium]|nr:tRNA (guanosine(46)-N7)-methyltransferase TrmB [Lachnospiraceae bacterium]